MFNNAQVEAIPQKLGLMYRWVYPDKGASSIIVEEAIEYKPYSNWIIDLRSGEKYHSDTSRRFKEMCKELKTNKES